MPSSAGSPDGSCNASRTRDSRSVPCGACSCRKAEAEGFYAVHRERPFFGSLTEFMSSGPAIVLVLEAPDAIKKWRTLMGATDPAKADAGTLRKEFAESIERNATHGSDAPETAAYEIGYFFAGVDLDARWGRCFVILGLGHQRHRPARHARCAVRASAGRLCRQARQLRLLLSADHIDRFEYPSDASLRALPTLSAPGDCRSTFGRSSFDGGRRTTNDRRRSTNDERSIGDRL